MKINFYPVSICFFIFISLLFISTASVAQTVRTVCTSGCGYTTIQSAVTAANSGDTILINVNGALTEKNISLPEKNLVFKGLGKNTTFLQSAATRASASGGRIFNYAAPSGAGSNVFTFLDMTIRYAYAPLTDLGGSQFQSAGGVFYASGTLKGLTINANNVKFYANETTGGNNINSGGACFYISASGSGFTYNADLTITNCDFDDNRVANSAGSSLSDGPCFDLLGSPARLTVNNCTFTNNNGYTRGGVVYVGSNWTVAMSNSLFSANTCRNGDGGCFSGRSGLSWAFDNCLFTGNSAVFVSVVNGNNGWGGVFLGKGAKFRNCTFYNNSAVKGGAICRSNNGSDEMQIINCTFYGNSASSTGKTIQYGSSTTGTTFPLTMVNTIITNGGGAASSEINFTLPYSQFINNIKNYCSSIGTDNGSAGTTPVFDFNSGNSTLNISSALAGNGGSTQTLSLLAGSSMINAGTFASGAGYDIPVKDQRNYSRTDGGIDIGAYEYNGITDDASAPAISYSAPGNTLITTDRVISATINDGNGVYWYPQSTDLRPRIYFKKNAGSWNSTTGSLASGTGINGVWNFSISSAAMGGLVNGDSVFYYIIAQDVSTQASIVSSPSGVNASSVNSIISAPSANAYRIGSSTLPVKLEKFSAKASGNNVIVKWEVSEEQNVSHYEIQRTTDIANWTTIGRIEAAHFSHYSFTDQNLAANDYYYRLVSIDLDGRKSISKIVQVRITNAGGILLYPNPATNGYVMLETKKSLLLSLYNSAGILIWKKQFPAGVHQIETGKLAAGVYEIVDDKWGSRKLIIK